MSHHSPQLVVCHSDIAISKSMTGLQSKAFVSMRRGHICMSVPIAILLDTMWVYMPRPQALAHLCGDAGLLLNMQSLRSLCTLCTSFLSSGGCAFLAPLKSGQNAVLKARKPVTPA